MDAEHGLEVACFVQLDETIQKKELIAARGTHNHQDYSNKEAVVCLCKDQASSHRGMREDGGREPLGLDCLGEGHFSMQGV